jgi:hypothetical protein
MQVPEVQERVRRLRCSPAVQSNLCTCSGHRMRPGYSSSMGYSWHEGAHSICRGNAAQGCAARLDSLLGSASKTPQSSESSLRGWEPRPDFVYGGSSPLQKGVFHYCHTELVAWRMLQHCKKEVCLHYGYIELNSCARGDVSNTCRCTPRVLWT